MYRTDLCAWCGQERFSGVKLEGGVKARKVLERLNEEQRAFQEGILCKQGFRDKPGKVLNANLLSSSSECFYW